MADASRFTLTGIPREEVDYVVISPNDPLAMRKLSDECVQLGIPYLFDPSQQIARNPSEDLKSGVENAHALFCNEYEFNLLEKHTGLSPEQIEKHVDLLVVTKGINGALVRSDGREYHIPVAPVAQIADPTGVGDAFRGGFLRGYRLGLDLQTCGQMGSLSAAYCLEQNGPSNHKYTIDEYIRRYRESFDDDGALDILQQ